MHSKVLVILLNLIFIPLAAQEYSYLIGNGHFICKVGDITRQNTQSIVNAANKDLVRGSGVCGAIFKASGADDLQKACEKHGGCPIGEARLTPSFKLADKGIVAIIHAVGPDCRIPQQDAIREALLKGAYANSFECAVANQITSISFPFISSAIYKYPKSEAADLAIDEITTQLKKHKNTVVEVRMVLFSEEDFKVFVEKLDTLGFVCQDQNQQNTLMPNNMNTSSKLEAGSSYTAPKLMLSIGLTALLAIFGYKYFKKSKKSNE